jgi:hypothetical protein
MFLFGNATSTPAAQGDKTTPKDPRAERQETQQTAPPALTEGEAATTEDEGDDPDLPAIAGATIDKDTYLQMRDEYIARIRGIDPGAPPDPRMRMNAIRTLQRQELMLYGNKALRPTASSVSPLSPFSPPSTTTWTELGPNPIPNGQTINTPAGTLVPVSGRVTAIAVHPTNPNIIYVGAAQGGVYRSLDGGATWTPLMDNALTLAIGAITIDPLNPSTVFVGTGEGERVQDSFFGVGIYRIENADTNPVLLGPFETRVAGTGTTAASGHAFLGTSITKIVVDPADDNRIFVGNTFGTAGRSDLGICCNGINPPSGSLGVYFSGNAMSANPVFSHLALTPTDTRAAVTDIVLEPGSSDNMLVAVEDALFNSPNSGIYRTTNASTASQSPSISPIFTETFPLTGQAVNIRFAMIKVGGVVTTLAATAANNGTLISSPDGGITWPTTISAAAGFCNSQCRYDMVVTLKPDDPNTFFLGGQAGGFALNRTVDGGTTFTTPNSTLHADTHAIVYAPSDFTVMYEGNDGGIWRSSNGGNTWTSRNTVGFRATQFESLALHPLDREFMIGGTQDNGTEFKGPDGSWLRVDSGDGGYALIDQNAANTTNVTMYHTYFNSNGTTNSTIQIGYVRHTGALPGPWFSSGCFGGVSRNGINCTDNVLFYAPMAQGPGSPNTVYFGSDRLYRSADMGATNVVISQAPIMTNTTGTGIPISTIGIAPQNDNVRIVGLINGHVFATTTGSSTLTDITGPWLLRYVARAVIDPNNQNVAYVTFDNYGLPAGRHVWKTTDLNDPAPVWTPAGNGIPDVPTNSIVVDPLNSNALYVATDIGVYASTDGGANWQPFGLGLPRVAGFDIAIQSPNRVLRVATHGRGLWEIAASLAPTTTSVTSSQNPSLFGQSVTFTATVTAQAGSPTGTVQFMDGVGTLGAPVPLTSGSATFTIASLSAGTHNITAVYSGNSVFTTSTGSVTQTVNQATTTTSVASDTNPSVFGQAVTFTATVSTVAPGSGTATGTVQFMDGGINLGAPVTLGGGSASFTSASLSVGTHSITAIYSGDANVTGSTGSLPAQTVSQAASSTAITSDTNPSVFGQAVTFTATISAVAPGSGTATGSVQFMDGGVNLSAPVTLTGGTATFTTASLSVGTHSISAVYSGDTNFTASTGSLSAQTVNQAASSTTITSNPNPSVFGQAVSFTATVSAVAPGSGTATGTVQFMDGGANLGSPVTLSGGSATFTTPSLSVGTHSITAVYSGDTNFTGSTGSLPTQTVNQASSSTAVASDTSPSVFGQAVTFTATVSAVAPGSGTATGTVQFMDGGVNLGAPVTLTGGPATFTTASLSVGTHSISAVYSGDTNFTASTGSLQGLTVNRASSAISVSSNNNPSVFGQAVTFTATVTAVAPGSGIATGTVAFFDGTTNLGSPALDASGHATLTTSALGAGTHNITVQYSGDGNFNPSAGSLPAQTVNQAGTTTVVTSSLNPSVFGQSVTFTATVASGAGTPSGTVQFTDGGVNLGPPVALSAGVATLTTASLSAGAHSISAVYSGDANFSGSTGSLNQTVGQAATITTISSSLNPSNFGQPVTFTAAVSSPAGIPTGVVQLLDGAASLGAPVALSGGVATFTTSSLSVGTHNITAVYSGDSNFNGSASPALAQVVRGTDIAVTLKHHPRVAVAGGRLTFVARVTNNGPQTANVSFTEQLTGDFHVVRARTSSGSCAISGGNIACSLGTIHNGNSVVVHVTLIPRRANSTIAATATATPNIGDTVPGNNTATDTAKVRARHSDDDDGDHDRDDDDDHDD